MTIEEIGCCGAYCRSCRASVTGSRCRGCKLGYGSGGRDISKSKCKIKLCCFRDRGLDSCADCPDYAKCDIIGSFYAKNGFKYRKYREAIEYIRENGYEEFIKTADSWKGPYGKLP